MKKEIKGFVVGVIMTIILTSGVALAGGVTRGRFSCYIEYYGIMSGKRRGAIMPPNPRQLSRTDVYHARKIKLKRVGRIQHKLRILPAFICTKN